jgi:hypothetical protein
LIIVGIIKEVKVVCLVASAPKDSAADEGVMTTNVERAGVCLFIIEMMDSQGGVGGGLEECPNLLDFRLISDIGNGG